jgi:hypothetical protein
MKRPPAALWVSALAVTAVSGCWRGAASVRLVVDPPGDGSCVGVSGFVVTMKPVGRDPIVQLLPNASPIESRNACRLPYEASAADIDAELPIDVTVDGYDSLDQLRVTGTARIPSLADPGDPHLALAAAGDPTAALLILDTSAALVGGSPADVTDVQISAKSPNCTNPNADIVPKTPVGAARFFATSPVAAFAASAGAMATLAPGDTVFVCLYFGTASVQGVAYTASPTADGYWRANPS